MATRARVSRANGRAKPTGKAASAKAAAKPAKAKAGPAKPKEKTTTGGIGHNLTAVRKQLRVYIGEYNDRCRKFEEIGGQHRKKIGDMIESAANALGCTRRVVRMVFKEQRDMIKAEAREKEMDPVERDDLETLRVAADLFEAADDREAREGRRDTANDATDDDPTGPARPAEKPESTLSF